MCESGVEGCDVITPATGGRLNRHFIEHQYFVEANLNVLVEFGNHVNPADALGDIQRLVFLFLRDVALQNALQPGDLRDSSSCRIEFGL